MSKKTPDFHQFDLMEAMEEAVFFVASDYRVHFTNTQVEPLTGLPSGEILGTDFLDLFTEDYREEVKVKMSESETSDILRMNTEIYNRAEERGVPVLLRVLRLSDPEAETQGVFALIQDLTDLVESLRAQDILREENRELHQLAITCPLTGVFNRRYFDLRFEEELERNERYRHGLGVIMTDLDKFKEVNDTYGHEVGDQAVVGAARIIRETLRSSDVVARFGGDEFIVALPEVKAQGVLAMAIRLRERIQKAQIETPQGVVQITSSIGLSAVQPGNEQIEGKELRRQADEALYQAKEAGGNTIVLYGHNLP